MSKKAELPIEYGLREVGDNGIINTIVQAPWRDDCLPSWAFISAICRRCFNDKMD